MQGSYLPPSALISRETDPIGKLRAMLVEMREHFEHHREGYFPVPLVERNFDLPASKWLSAPKWLSANEAIELIKLQVEPYNSDAAFARLCQIIIDQYDRKERGLNYAFSKQPPTTPMLEGFEVGSVNWFRAVYRIYKDKGDGLSDELETFTSDFFDWALPFDHLRVMAWDIFDNLLQSDWSVYEYSLPEAKQNPIWTFPTAMAWIATREYIALARVGHFRTPSNPDEAVAEDGVCRYNTESLGWLHTDLSYRHCKCGALTQFQHEAYKHCTCISVAWEELVHFRGGLSADTPELVFNLQEGWLSMTWPEGADDIRFLRRDILERWPPLEGAPIELTQSNRSTAAAEHECQEWLLKEFAADPNKLRSKSDFRDAALSVFAGRLSARGFDLRVWPSLAATHGRDGAGAKRKSN